MGFFNLCFVFLSLIVGVFNMDMENHLVANNQILVIKEFHSCMMNVTFGTAFTDINCPEQTKACLDALFEDSERHLNKKTEFMVKADIELELKRIIADCRIATRTENVLCQMTEVANCLSQLGNGTCDDLKFMSYCLGPLSAKNCSKRTFPSVLRRISLGMWETLKCRAQKQRSGEMGGNYGYTSKPYMVTPVYYETVKYAVPAKPRSDNFDLSWEEVDHRTTAATKYYPTTTTVYYPTKDSDEYTAALMYRMNVATVNYTVSNLTARNLEAWKHYSSDIPLYGNVTSTRNSRDSEDETTTTKGNITRLGRAVYTNSTDYGMKNLTIVDLVEGNSTGFPVKFGRMRLNITSFDLVENITTVFNPAAIYFEKNQTGRDFTDGNFTLDARSGNLFPNFTNLGRDDLSIDASHNRSNLDRGIPCLPNCSRGGFPFGSMHQPEFNVTARSMGDHHNSSGRVIAKMHARQLLNSNTSENSTVVVEELTIVFVGADFRDSKNFSSRGQDMAGSNSTGRRSLLSFNGNITNNDTSSMMSYNVSGRGLLTDNITEPWFTNKTAKILNYPNTRETPVYPTTSEMPVYPTYPTTNQTPVYPTYPTASQTPAGKSYVYTTRAYLGRQLVDNVTEHSQFHPSLNTHMPHSSGISISPNAFLVALLFTFILLL